MHAAVELRQVVTRRGRVREPIRGELRTAGGGAQNLRRRAAANLLEDCVVFSVAQIETRAGAAAAAQWGVASQRTQSMPSRSPTAKPMM